MTRLGHRPDVEQAFNAVLPQQSDEFLDRTVRMADGADEFRSHVRLSLFNEYYSRPGRNGEAARRGVVAGWRPGLDGMEAICFACLTLCNNGLLDFIDVDEVGDGAEAGAFIA